MKFLVVAQAEMNASIAERKIATALTKNLLPAANSFYRLEKELFVCSGKGNKWIGSLIVVYVIQIMITIQSFEGTIRKTYNAFQIKPFYCSSDFNIQFFRTKPIKSSPRQIHLKNIIRPSYPRVRNFNEGKMKELGGLIKSQIWKAFLQKKYLQRQIY